MVNTIQKVNIALCGGGIESPFLVHHVEHESKLNASHSLRVLRLDLQDDSKVSADIVKIEMQQASAVRQLHQKTRCHILLICHTWHSEEADPIIFLRQ